MKKDISAKHRGTDRQAREQADQAGRQTHRQTYKHTDTCMHACKYVRTYSCMHAYVRACMHECALCMYDCTACTYARQIMPTGLKNENKINPMPVRERSLSHTSKQSAAYGAPPPQNSLIFSSKSLFSSEVIFSIKGCLGLYRYSSYRWLCRCGLYRYGLHNYGRDS